MTKFVFESLENVGKGENAGYQQAFPPFPTVFSKAFLFTEVNSRDCVVKRLTFTGLQPQSICRQQIDYASNN